MAVVYELRELFVRQLRRVVRRLLSLNPEFLASVLFEMHALLIRVIMRSASLPNKFLDEFLLHVLARLPTSASSVPILVVIRLVDPGRSSRLAKHFLIHAGVPKLGFLCDLSSDVGDVSHATP